MGFLRLFFALSVVVAHAGATIFGYTFFNSTFAVTAFFVISGFYMSLILHEKYTQHNAYSLFITNRFLRIYPTYLLVLILIIALSGLLVLQGYPSLLSTTEYTNNIYFYTNFNDVLSNFTLLIRPDYFEINPDKFQPFTIGPAWTLSLELLFYLIAPFVVKSTKKIVLLIIVSIIIRYLLYYYAMIHNVQPSVRFFPVELVYFLLGAISYKIYGVLKKKKPRKQRTLIFAVSFILFTIFYNYIPINHSTAMWMNMKENIYIASLFLLIPFCFLFFKDSRFDRKLGDLSYPVYLIHLFVGAIFTIYFHSIDKNLYVLLIILLTLLLSYATVTFFEKPIDTWRQKRLTYNLNKAKS